MGLTAEEMPLRATHRRIDVALSTQRVPLVGATRLAEAVFLTTSLRKEHISETRP